MPALIDNYTALDCVTETQPRVANVRYVSEIHKPITSSITVSFSYQIGVNNRIVKLLEEYKLLENNWDEDDAVAPSAVALNKSLLLTKILEMRGQPVFHAAPGPNCEIMLDIRNSKNTKSLEIIFYADRAVAVKFPEEGRPSQQHFEFQQLPDLLQWLNQK
jgi:hypothetical protein